jgi:hypothetical protein
MRIEPFYLFIVDHDNKTFTKVGPMSDDTNWNDRVVDMQKKGKNINCFSVDTKNIDSSIRDYEIQMDYKYSPNLNF